MVKLLALNQSDEGSNPLPPTMEYWNLQSYEKQNSWSGDEDGEVLWLLTPEELKQLACGTVVKCIDGSSYKVGVDILDDDTRAGYLAFGLVEYLT